MEPSGEEVRIRNIVNLWIVFSLWKGRTHGYEIIKEIEEGTGKRPSTSQIYPFLQKLEEKDLVTSRKTGDRGKKVYSLTEKGESFVRSKIEMFSEIISETIEKDLDTCAHCGCKVYEGGHSESVDGEKLMFCCQHCASSYKRTFE